MSWFSSKPLATTWCLSDSGGGDMTVGLSKFLFVGGGAGVFYVKEDSAPASIGLKYAGVEFGGGVGVSAGGPVSASLSVPGMPSVGTGRIFRNPLRSSGSFGLDDIKGAYVSTSLGAGVGFAGSGVVIYVGASELLVNLLSALVAPMALQAQLALCQHLSKGFALFTSTSATSSIAAGVTVTRGHIF